MPTYKGCNCCSVLSLGLAEPLAKIGAKDCVSPSDTASTKGCIAVLFCSGITASALLPSANLATCSLLNTPPVACPGSTLLIRLLAELTMLLTLELTLEAKLLIAEDALLIVFDTQLPKLDAQELITDSA